MKKYLKVLPIAAMLLGGGLALATNSSKKVGNRFDNPVYFSYLGTPGHEDNPANWQEVSAADYASLSCAEQINGCGIVQNASTTTGSAPNRKPSSVPVTGTGSSMTPSEDGTFTIQADNRNPLP